MRLAVLLPAVLLLSSCGIRPFRRASAPPPPPGPVPVRIPDQVSTEPAPPPKNLPPPPSMPTPEAKPAEAAVLAIPKAPTGKPPRAAKPKKVAKLPPPPPPATQPVEEPAPEGIAPPPYRLGELRSPEEKEKLRKQGEQYLGVCAAALSAAEGRSLTAMQSEMVNRVRSFSQQARETMDKDPVEARNLAAKGKTFAEALLAELR